MSTLPKFYLYVSDAKVEMLHAQIPRAFLDGVSGELETGLPGIGKVTLKQEPGEKGGFHRVAEVCAYLERQRLVGGVHDEQSYFTGEMEMSWGYFEQENLVVLYSSQSGVDTFLAGSGHHLIGDDRGVPKTRMRGSHMFHVVEALRMVTGREDDERCESDDPVDLACFPGADLFRTVGLRLRSAGIAQRVSFMARRLRDFGAAGESKVVIGSPIYVALSDSRGERQALPFSP